MLARRFTIVCLVITIFGMGLSILAAERSLPARTGVLLSCDIMGGCPVLPRR